MTGNALIALEGARNEIAGIEARSIELEQLAEKRRDDDTADGTVHRS